MHLSLRTRLAVLLAALVALVAAAASFASYSTTRRQLFTEVDRSLDRRVGAPAPSESGDHDDNENPHPTEVLRELTGAVVQHVKADGTVETAGVVRLPVDEEDRAVAAGDLPTHSRTVSVSGVTLRVLTRPEHDGAVQLGREVSEQLSVLDRLRDRLVLLTIAAALVGALVGWALARWITGPLRRLTETAEHIASTNDLTADVNVTRRDEIGRLGRTFESMVSSLRLSRDQQTRLVQDASHEIRTPITSIRANVELLQRARAIDETDRAAVFSDVLAELDELSSLTNELVELATAADAPDAEPFRDGSLEEPVARAVDRFRRRSGREVSLTLDQPLHRPLRPAALERAIDNLLHNAGKFSPDGTPVEVTVRGGRVSVTDHGPGIPPDERPLVFQRFYRSVGSRGAPGSGLGLAIVARIVEAHDGSVFVEETPGGGATIGFDLPAGSVDPASRARAN